MLTIKEQKEQDKKLKEYIFRESLKVNKETKEALCRIERKGKQENKENREER